MQDSRTSQLIFGIAELVSYLSGVCTLNPGDLIYTGTPPGVGVARKPPVYLKPGDTVEVEIEKIGTLRNPVIAEVVSFSLTTLLWYGLPAGGLDPAAVSRRCSRNRLPRWPALPGTSMQTARFGSARHPDTARPDRVTLS